MTQINFHKLIAVAPFEEHTKSDILAKENSLSEAQKYELTHVAWQLLAEEYKNKLRFMISSALWEMAQKKKHYTPNDFSEMQVKLYMDFARRLEMTGTQEEVEGVREELKKHLRKPNN
jgi:hypothetical protein